VIIGQSDVLMGCRLPSTMAYVDLIPSRLIADAKQIIYASGCIPLVPETMEIVAGGVEEQTVSTE
jgi:enamine deaminase RidA (YjgF/YER057c/UK114 family)